MAEAGSSLKDSSDLANNQNSDSSSLVPVRRRDLRSSIDLATRRKPELVSDHQSDGYDDGPSTSFTSSATEPSDISSILRQKEHDIEIAAQIGQTLLERNRELQMRNEFLEESIACSNDQAVQLRHELQKRIELLRFFSIDDEDHRASESTTGSLCRQLERLKRENIRLTAEHTSLKKDADSRDVDYKASIKGIGDQLSLATASIAKLQALITRKNEECASQSENVSRLLAEITRRSNREKELMEENTLLMEQLDAAANLQEELSQQMLAMQNMYTEVKSMFEDAEEELRQYRKKPSSYRTPSIDSLYDSLASELENSDSGGGMAWSPRIITSPRRPRTASVKNTSGELCAGETGQEGSEKTPICEMPPSRVGTLMAIEESQSTSSDKSQSQERLEPAATPLQSSQDPAMAPLQSSPAPVTIPTQGRLTPAKTPLLRSPAPEEPSPIHSASEHKESEHESTKSLLKQLAELVNLPAESNELELPPHPEPSDSPQLPDSRDSTPTIHSRSSSSHSLSDYEAPPLGEPGVPGTRDLHASIKRLSKVRRQVRENHSYSMARDLFGFMPSALSVSCMANSVDSHMSSERGESEERREPQENNHQQPPSACYLERDYAAFRARKGLQPSAFFPSGRSSCTPSAEENLSMLHHPLLVGDARTCLPWRICAAVGLNGAPSIQPERHSIGSAGVLRRVELPSASPDSSPHRSLGGSPSADLRLSLTRFIPSSGVIVRSKHS